MSCWCAAGAASVIASPPWSAAGPASADLAIVAPALAAAAAAAGRADAAADSAGACHAQ